jgi:tRNA(His) guanylyltransferase
VYSLQWHSDIKCRPPPTRAAQEERGEENEVSDDIGDRFKGYEAVFDYALPRRLPMVIRVDGRAFHGLKLAKPFDDHFFDCMAATAKALCREIQGAKLAYFQSDEISIIARDDMQNTTQPWVGKRLSKLVSLSAAVATATFNDAFGAHNTRQFDSRAFVVPDLNEVVNYCIWRQQDASRNSVSMAARAIFSHKECHLKTTSDLIDRLRAAETPWEDTPTHFKRGAVCRVVRVNRHVEYLGTEIERNEWQIDTEPPIFTQDRAYIETLYAVVE